MHACREHTICLDHVAGDLSGVLVAREGFDAPGAAVAEPANLEVERCVEPLVGWSFEPA